MDFGKIVVHSFSSPMLEYIYCVCAPSERGLVINNEVKWKKNCEISILNLVEIKI